MNIFFGMVMYGNHRRREPQTQTVILKKTAYYLTDIVRECPASQPLILYILNGVGSDKPFISLVETKRMCDWLMIDRLIRCDLQSILLMLDWIFNLTNLSQIR